MARAPHPDDARQTLRELGERRSLITRLEVELHADLGPAIEQAIAAGLSKVEIAELAGIGRASLYRRLGT